MTPADLIFLYFCACAVSWGAYWMREWERRDRERQFKDPLSHPTVGFKMSIESVILSNHRPVNWIPTGFCTKEYQINEILNQAFIKALWPKIRKEVLDPLDQLEKDIERDNQPIVDRVLNRWNRKA